MSQEQAAEPRQVSISFSRFPGLMARVAEYRWQNRVDTTSDTVCRLVEIGLSVSERREAAE